MINLAKVHSFNDPHMESMAFLLQSEIPYKFVAFPFSPLVGETSNDVQGMVDAPGMVYVPSSYSWQALSVSFLRP